MTTAPMIPRRHAYERNMSIFVSSHTLACILPHGTASLSAVVFCFHTPHTGCSTCLSHCSVKTVSKHRRCVSPGVLCLREAVMPITAPAGPPITHRQAHAETRPEKTSKQDNNRQQSLNTLVILFGEISISAT